MQDTKRIFVDGMRFEKPKPGAPEWLKGKISIKADDCIKFIRNNANDKGWMNIDLKRSKEGKLYLELNTFNAPKTPSETSQNDSDQMFS